MTRTLFHTVTQTTGNETVEDILRTCMGARRAAIARAKRAENGITLDGVRTRVTAPVKEGQIVGLLIDDTLLGCVSANVEPEEGQLSIAYEDDDLIIVDKAAGMALHPGPSHPFGTLANYLAGYLSSHGEAGAIHPVQRLDLDTTGLVVFAKSAFVHDRLQRQLHTNDFSRTYLAWCEGVPSNKSGVIDIPIDSERPQGKRSRYFASEEGKPAITQYEVVWSDRGKSLVRLRLGTGRTHQIRIHMAHIGHPLLGDCTYGTASPLIGRPALHSWKLSMAHPIAEKTITVQAALPEDMRLFG